MSQENKPNNASESNLETMLKRPVSKSSRAPAQTAKSTEKDEKLEKKKLENRSFKQDIKERKKFAGNAYSITQAWIGFLIVLTFAQFLIGGEKGIVPGLSEAAFIAVFTTTTASVFGFWFLVGKYLFDTGKPDSN